MDLICIKCSEPIDTDEIHSLISEDPDLAPYNWTELVSKFAAEGCRALNLRCNQQGGTAPAILKEGYELLAGDPDAQAALAEELWL